MSKKQPNPMAYYFKGADDGKACDLYIYGIIGWEVMADAITQDIANFQGETINVHINSCGGSVVEANAIFNAIKTFNGTKTAIIDGMAGSASSYIMLACDTIKAQPNATIFIHNPLVEWASGNAEDLKKVADNLEKFESEYLSAYMAKTGKDENEIRIAMDEETLFTAQEAKDFGLIDEVISDAQESQASAKCTYKIVAQFFTKENPFKATKTESQEHNKQGVNTKMEIKNIEDLVSALTSLKDGTGENATKNTIGEIITALDGFELKKKEEEPKEPENKPEPKKDETSALTEEAVQARIDKAVATAIEATENKFNAMFLAKGAPASGTEAPKKTGMQATSDAYTKKFVNKK